MVVANQLALPPGASLEGVGRGWSSRVLFSLMMRLRKKKSIHNRFILLFYIPPDFFASKTMESCFPHAPPPLNLLAFLSFLMPMCFWLVVAFVILIGSHLRLQRFYFYFVVAQFAAPKVGMASAPHVPPRSCSLPNIPPTKNANFWLVVVLSDQKMAA
jgi:hypothetical protein